jgi:hypothetical protein
VLFSGHKIKIIFLNFQTFKNLIVMQKTNLCNDEKKFIVILSQLIELFRPFFSYNMNYFTVVNQLIFFNTFEKLIWKLPETLKFQFFGEDFCDGIEANNILILAFDKLYVQNKVTTPMLLTDWFNNFKNLCNYILKNRKLTTDELTIVQNCERFFEYRMDLINFIEKTELLQDQNINLQKEVDKLFS